MELEIVPFTSINRTPAEDVPPSMLERKHLLGLSFSHFDPKLNSLAGRRFFGRLTGANLTTQRPRSPAE